MRSRSKRARESHPFTWILIGWFVFVFLVGGSARADTTSLLALRPLAVAMCALALLGLTKEQARTLQPLLIVAGALFLLVFSQLIPLPPALWQSLPQRELIAEIDRAMTMPDIWRPLSIAPPRTWNALYSLFVPLSVLLLLGRTEPSHSHPRLLAAALALAAASSVFGMLQLSASATGPLYPYRIDNAGSPIGFFANRNHQAVFLASCFPLLAAFASAGEDDGQTLARRRILAAALAAVLVVMLVILGSRAGLLSGVLGLGMAAFILWRQSDLRERGFEKRWLALAAAGLVAALVAAAILSARAESIARLLGRDDTAELRLDSLSTVLSLAGAYLPLGSGFGTFVEAYQRVEPMALLQPQYMNHAHNDYLEWLIGGGLPSVALVVWTGGLLLRAGWRQRRLRPVLGAGAEALVMPALAGMAILAFASIFDYPLRTPAMMAYATILFGFALHKRPPARGVA